MNGQQRINLLIELVNKVTDTDTWSRTDRVMFVRYFLRENFTWLTLKSIAEMTGITNQSTVSLQIKKLNSEEKYHFTILKIRRMIRELEL